MANKANNNPNKTARFLYTLFRDNPHCDIAEIPLLRQLLLAHRPELLRKTNEAETQRNRIRDYLFGPSPLQNTALKKELFPPLFDTLFMLKKMLREFNWRIVEESMKQKKADFGKWLDSVIEEEE